MADELADQIEPGEVINDSPIQDAPADTGIEPAEKPEKSAKPQTLRQTLEKSVETVREAEAKKDKTGRLHHPADGKYVPKDKPVEAQAPAEIQEKVKDAQPKEPSAAVGLPPGFSPETKAFVSALPADHPLRKDLDKREKEVSDGFKKYSDRDKQFQEIEQVLAPSRPVYQQHGLKSDAEAIKALFGWEASFRNPATRIQAFNNLAQRYGINLNSPQSQAPDANGIPEQLRPVYDQFGQLTQTVSSIQSELQRSREEQVSQTLTSFAKDKPHFEKVRVRMGQLIQAGIVQPTDLDGAYQQACWADPDIRTALTKEQFEKQQAELKKNQTTHAQTAQRAAISPSTRSPNSLVVNGAKPGKLSVRETIQQSVKELQDQRA